MGVILIPLYYVQVGDIYGGDYPAIGLKKTTIASTFGKLQCYCHPSLTPANLCVQKWVKQAHRRRIKASANESTMQHTALQSRIPSSRRRMTRSRTECVHRKQYSEIVARPSIHSSESVWNDWTNPLSPETSTLCLRHVPYKSSEIKSFFTSAMSPSCKTYRRCSNATSTSTISSKLLPPSGRTSTSFGPTSPASLPSSCSIPPSFLCDTVASEEIGPRPNCDDPLCCCCGLRRWAHCETSEASAAAAVGILPGPQIKSLHQRSQLRAVPDTIEDSPRESSDLNLEFFPEFTANVALGPSRGIVDDQTAANRRRASSTDPATREVRETMVYC